MKILNQDVRPYICSIRDKLSLRMVPATNKKVITIAEIHISAPELPMESLLWK